MLPDAPMPSRSRFRIRCVNRTDRSAVHQKIRFIGGLNADGSAWKLSQEMAVNSIESGKCQTLSGCGSPGRAGARRNSAPRPQVFKSRNRSRGAKLVAQLTRVSFLDSGTLGVKRRPTECSNSKILWAQRESNFHL